MLQAEWEINHAICLENGIKWLITGSDEIRPEMDELDKDILSILTNGKSRIFRQIVCARQDQKLPR
jgi:hypothetical protein